MENDLVDRFTQLLIERSQLEAEMYDYLVAPLINESFWEPVIVCLTPEQISRMKETDSIENIECDICNELVNLKELGCCKKTMCGSCIDKWFSKSVKCPFCVCDTRELIGNTELT